MKVSSTGNLTRRRLLGSVAAGASLAALSSCVTDSGSPGPQKLPSGNAPALPTYRAFEGITSDLPGNAAGIMPTYLAYPDPPVPYSHDGVLEGATITAMVTGNSAPLTPVDRNSFWQELNRRLGGDLRLDVPPSSSQYNAKFSVRIAGGDLPDIFNVRHQTTPQLGGLLQNRCQDLTDLLSGDKVLDYPSLANLPTESWRAMTFEGRLYGWPFPQARLGNALVARTDVMKSVGATGEIANGEDFLELCRALTSSKDNRWAATQPGSYVRLLQEMLEAPNNWRETNGSFLHTYETPETERAIALVQKMWVDGLFDPDAFGNTLSQYRTLGSGRTAMMYGGWQQWPATIRDNRPLNPEYGATAIPLPKYDGGGLARKHMGIGASMMVCVKKTDDEATIRKCLALADRLAAPFGTEAFKFNTFGLPGIHHTESDGVFALTEKGLDEVTNMPKSYIGTSATVSNWQPMGMRDLLLAVHDYQTTVMTDPLADPSVGLYSSTNTAEGPNLSRLMNDHINEVIQGRKEMSTWQAKVDEWRKSGGNKIRSEYEESFQRANG